MEKNKTIKILTIFMSSLISSLLIPVIGQWYEQQTGITPYAFYILSGIGAFAILIALAIDAVDGV